jgi:hypothetical protein
VLLACFFLYNTHILYVKEKYKNTKLQTINHIKINKKNKKFSKIFKIKKMKFFSNFALFFLLTKILALNAQTTPISNQFYDKFIFRSSNPIPYGANSGDSTLIKGDDNLYLINLNHPINIYDSSYYNVYISINGYVSFGPISGSSIPTFSSLSSPVIAGLSVDLITSTNGNIFYRETTDQNVLNTLVNYLQTYYKSGIQTHLCSAPLSSSLMTTFHFMGNQTQKIASKSYSLQHPAVKRTL